jgi:hypothetical protein
VNCPADAAPAGQITITLARASMTLPGGQPASAAEPAASPMAPSAARHMTSLIPCLISHQFIG